MDGGVFERPVDEVVVELLSGLGVPPTETARLIETILIRDGRYVGHSFRAGPFRAFWRAGSRCIEVQDSTGTTVASASLAPTGQDQERAA